MAPTPVQTEAYSLKELELMAKLKALEEDRIKFVEIVRGKVKKLENELVAKTEECVRLSERNKELEGIMKDLSAFSGKGKNKSDDDDTLTRAKELLFEKTKICKKQELQLEALNNQIEANKDVLDITKDMLNLKNIENDHMQSRLDSMKLRVKSENDRFLLTEKKLNLAKQKEIALTKEYETQRNIFKDLKETYEAKVNILTKQVETLKQKK
ncbi:E3 ubiquitin-protein ligase BRE1A [Sitodiplosis mosellana]|uniref:E3 ubiquitin-protein ligase BRE1A n=1 Tax=Sitodiplosis mosellana TaxID=263140 RepID=UPI00244452C8|nr:E3 ubiquitin-protein ligase BRE1A [Sitodiplosis mosellana]